MHRYLSLRIWKVAESWDATVTQTSYILPACCVSSILLGTQAAQQGHIVTVLQFSSFCSCNTVCPPVTEAWMRHRGDMQEATVASGQKGQRDPLNGKTFEGFMESLWETLNGTEYFGSSSTKTERWHKATETKAGSDLRALHKLDLYLIEKGSHQGVLKLGQRCDHMYFFPPRKWGIEMAVRKLDGPGCRTLRWQYGLGRMEGQRDTGKESPAWTSTSTTFLSPCWHPACPPPFQKRENMMCDHLKLPFHLFISWQKLVHYRNVASPWNSLRLDSFRWQDGCGIVSVLTDDVISMW